MNIHRTVGPPLNAMAAAKSGLIPNLHHGSQRHIVAADKEVHMNKTILALTTALLLAGGAATSASAQDVIFYTDDPIYAYSNGDVDSDGIPNAYDRYDDRYDRYGNLVRFEVGARLPMGYFGTATYVDHRLYGLSPPPYGYRWNRVGNNVYLVSTSNGLIVDVIYNLFR